MERFPAILLLGPTGSGKTPLGHRLEETGLWGRRCVHFDFGANLRQAGEAESASRYFTPDEIQVIRDVLQTGDLLEDRHFHIAEKILRTFTQEMNLRSDDYLVLNGFPRHAGQAGDIEKILAIRTVVYLTCTARIVVERIRLNAGGDRSERTDDSVDEIRTKLRIFRTHTLPLIHHYQSRQIPVIRFRIRTHTRPDEIIAHLSMNRQDTVHIRGKYP
jgi:adenylate kinase family enzyme